MTSLDRDEIRSEMLCMLPVPASMTVHDLLQFTAPLGQGIELMRIIERDSTQNQYMVLIKFKQQVRKQNFYQFKTVQQHLLFWSAWFAQQWMDAEPLNDVLHTYTRGGLLEEKNNMDEYYVYVALVVGAAQDKNHI